MARRRGRPRRKGGRSDHQVYILRSRQETKEIIRKTQAIRRYRKAVARRKAFIAELRKDDAKKIIAHRIHLAKVDRLERRRRENAVSGAASKATKSQNAARSARSKSVTPGTKQVTTWKSPQQLAALNERRKETRNSWSNQDCVKKPSSRNAGRIRQAGKAGSYEPRPWC